MVQSVLIHLERLVATTRAFIRKHWQQAIRIRQKLRFSEETFHLVLAGGVGVIGGLVNLIFHHAISLMETLFHQRAGDPAKLEGDYSPLVILEKLLIPTVGGLVAGLVLFWGLRLVGKQRSHNMLEVVVTSDGRLPFRASLVNAGSSLLSIGSGASIGREGAITELAAMFASKWGQLAHWQPYRLRLLTACGAASGISAAYNAPITGAVFAALIVLGNFSMNLFAPLVFSSVVASMVSRSFFGMKPWYEVPAFNFTQPDPIAVVSGAGSSHRRDGRDVSEDAATQRGPFSQIARRPFMSATGHRRIGGGRDCACIYPGRLGQRLRRHEPDFEGEYLRPEVPLRFLLGLFAAKLLATLATVGSGAVGGVFTPTLFLGAGLGAIWGTALHGLVREWSCRWRRLRSSGMGSMLAATTRSPLLAMIMAFEISLNYSVMPPLMLACVISTLVARRLHPESIYTEPLREEGPDAGPRKLAPGHRPRNRRWATSCARRCRRCARPRHCRKLRNDS